MAAYLGVDISPATTTVGEPVTITFDNGACSNSGSCFHFVFTNSLNGDFSEGEFDMDDADVAGNCYPNFYQITYTPTEAGTHIIEVFETANGTIEVIINSTGPAFGLVVNDTASNKGGGFMTFFA